MKVDIDGEQATAKDVHAPRSHDGPCRELRKMAGRGEPSECRSIVIRLVYRRRQKHAGGKETPK